MYAFDTTMKTCVLLLTITVAVVYVNGEYCPSGDASDCIWTNCGGNEWVLSCVDGVCVCIHTEGGSHGCSNNGDCGRGHSCPDGMHWRCIQGACVCTHSN